MNQRPLGQVSELGRDSNRGLQSVMDKLNNLSYALPRDIGFNPAANEVIELINKNLEALKQSPDVEYSEGVSADGLNMIKLKFKKVLGLDNTPLCVRFKVHPFNKKQLEPEIVSEENLNIPAKIE